MHVEELLREFDAVDPGSYTFRYPVNTQGQPSVPHHFMLYMPTFCHRKDVFLSALEAVIIGLAVTRGQMMEVASYAQNNADNTSEPS